MQVECVQKLTSNTFDIITCITKELIMNIFQADT